MSILIECALLDPAIRLMGSVAQCRLGQGLGHAHLRRRGCAFIAAGMYVFACRGWCGCLRVGRSAGPDIALSACALLDPAHGAHDPAQCRLGQGLGHAQFAPTGLRIAAGMYGFARRGWRGCLRVVALLVWVAVECAWRARGTRALQASPAPYTATLAAAR